ncbi:MAG TPA: rhodanese-like domain-containing protein [Gemmatimonadaceae bacterium]
MLLKRFYDTKLAQASYLLGCQATGEALVIDANRDADQYLEAAQDEGLRITHVTETHIHADFVSGSRELASRSQARLLLSAEGGSDWQYAFAEGDGATLLRGGDTFMVGNLRVEVLHTPGHTPEHLCFVVTDTPATDRPMGVFTGDFVFVGDVGRPDLLEKAAKVEGAMREGARALFASIQRFKALPDYLQLWPGHGAGSACGKALGAVPSTTLGYERIANWALADVSEDAFTAMVLAGQPEPPRYFAAMKRINREGPPLLGGMPHPRRLADTALTATLDRGALLVDIRPTADFAEGHVPGALNIPLNAQFTTRAGWFVPYERAFYLLASGAQGEAAVTEAAHALAMIGLDRVEGWFGEGAIEAWTADGGVPQQVPQVTPEELAARAAAGELETGRTVVVDVRGREEFEAGHIPGVRHIVLGLLPDHLDELPRDVPLVLQCQTGGRSSVAASVLQAAGFTNVSNLARGITGWREAGEPVEQGAGAPVPG